MGQWVRLGISCGWVMALCGWLSVDTAAAEPVKVRIITRTNDNVAVNVTIERQKDGGEWKNANATSRGMGVYELFEEVCNDTIAYRAISTRSFIAQITIREVKCTYPEVVFADFYVTSAATLIERFTETEAWIRALRGVENAEGYAAMYADEVRAAYANADYGKIAILGSEIASQLRAAGKPQDAEAFAVLSVDATARGAAVRRKLDPDSIQVLVFDPVVSSVVLSEQARSVLETYQIEDLGFTKSAPTFGKADWKTMRSLDGGQKVLSSRVRLPEAAVTDFTADPFLSGMP